MPSKSVSAGLSACTAFVAGSALVSVAGPLNPPGGAVASTYKTLSEVEPRIAINAANTPGDADSLFRITQPGSYYLTGNITGVVGKHGIEIAASGVTLDLSGFDLVGVPGMGAFDGVSTSVGGLTNVAVVNGSVRNWGNDGVDLGTLSATNCRLESVVASGNTSRGIRTSSGATITNCSAYDNSGSGISTGSGCTVVNCSSYSNTFNGISTGSGCTVVNCSSYSNTIDGISPAFGCTVSNCTAYDNTGNGIITASDCTVLDCSASSNAINGISLVGDNCTVVNCTASANAGHGISAFNGCTITNCTANNNLARGINTNNGCQVTGCLTRNNQSDGIVVNFACTVSGSTCNGDGTAAGDQGGIRVLGQANRVESNNVTFADRGLLVDAGGNVIVRNTVSSCTVNWVVAANNKCLVVLGINGAAINGNSGGTAPGSTDPNANFSY